MRILPRYIGGKARWLERLAHLRGQDFTEVFAGTASLSMNLAKTAILNDADPIIYRVLSRYPELEVPEVFSVEDYNNVRWREDWWRWCFCLSKFGFGGDFGYSKYGFSRPPVRTMAPQRMRPDYERALERWRALAPTVTNVSFEQVPEEHLRGRVVIIDPPYEGSHAGYNAPPFNYEAYWPFVRRAMDIASTTVVFDRELNLRRHLPDQRIETRAMGSCRQATSSGADKEAMCLVQN